MIKDLLRFLKIFGFLVLLFITLLACHNHKTLTNAEPILEITQDARGMGGVTGKILFFRVYNNGIVEFHTRSFKKSTQVGFETVVLGFEMRIVSRHFFGDATGLTSWCPKTFLPGGDTPDVKCDPITVPYKDLERNIHVTVNK